MNNSTANCRLKLCTIWQICVSFSKFVLIIMPFTQKSFISCVQCVSHAQTVIESTPVVNFITTGQFHQQNVNTVSLLESSILTGYYKMIKTLFISNVQYTKYETRCVNTSLMCSWITIHILNCKKNHSFCKIPCSVIQQTTVFFCSR